MPDECIHWDEILRSGEDLPTCPSIAVRLVDRIGCSTIENGQLETVLLWDPAVAIRVLRLANSSLFGKPGRISTIAHAVALLEAHVARLVGLSFVFSPRMGQINGFDHLEYWKRSWATSLAASRTSRHFPEVNVEEARLAGLLADVGQLMLAEARGQDYGAIREQAQARGQTLALTERELMGTDHAAVAARVLSEWHIPSSIVEAIGVQGDWSSVHHLPEHSREIARVLYLSKEIVRLAGGVGGEDIESVVDRFSDWARVDRETVESIVGFVASELANSDELFCESEATVDQIKESARRALLEASLATAQTLSATARQAEEHERRADEFRRERDNLKRQVTLDPVLNIGNRRYFDARLLEEHKRGLRTGRPLSLILFDLDNFKTLNDTYGHPVGDEALRASTRTIAKCLRSSDVFARYGGEEFAVICPETDLVGAMSLADRMRHCLERLELHQRNGVVRLTASFGVSTLDPPQEASSTQDIVESADQWLFEAKRAGRNCVRGSNFPVPESPVSHSYLGTAGTLAPTEWGSGPRETDL